MPYTKQVWPDATRQDSTGARLNYIEQGIATAQQTAEITSPLVSGTFPSQTFGPVTTLSSGSNTLALSVGGSSRLSIDTSGRVTTPNVPAFLAVRVSMSNAGATQTLTYNTTQQNNGSHLNTSTGLFTAPVAGRYWFFFGAFKETSVATAVQVQFIVNGVANGNFRGYTDNGAYAAVSPLAGAFFLNANDTIGVQINSGTIHGNSNGIFSGFLIG